jgi:N-acetylglucosamine kinase-like BadF-type ATPase
VKLSNAPAAVLAIDGGNSKTDVALIGSDGSLLASARGPGTSVDDRRIETSLVVFDDLVTAVARQADIDPQGMIAEHTSAFVAGADLPQEERRLAEVLSTRDWSPSIRTGNDTFAVLRAGTRRPWGVGVTCGAGINCVGVAPGGEQTRFLALGRFTGDWGGGLDLGVEVMWWATRAEDGRGEPTALSRAVADYFGRATACDVAVGIHLGELDTDDLIRLTHVLFEVATTGDDVAIRLVDRLADEISVLALVAMRRLRLTEVDTELALGGGVLMARNPRLLDGISRRVLAEVPAARIAVVDVPPIAGAALLGLDHLGLAQSAHERLRAAYTTAAVG